MFDDEAPPATLDQFNSTPRPAWAGGYQLQTRSDGRVYWHAVVDGCDVWAQPKAWAMLTLKGHSAATAAGTLNYGLQVGDLAAHSGRLETNSATFGRELLGASTGAESPLPPFGPAARADYQIPALILVLGLVAVALVVRLKSRRV